MELTFEDNNYMCLLTLCFSKLPAAQNHQQ